MKEFKLPVAIAKTVIRSVEISTLKLNSMGRKRKRYQTNVYLSNGSIEVVALYSTAKSAHLGHVSLVTKFISR
jgi:hypothetical protein